MFWCNICGHYVSGNTDGYEITLNYSLRYKVTRELKMCPECFKQIKPIFDELFYHLDEAEGKLMEGNPINSTVSKEEQDNG